MGRVPAGSASRSNGDSRVIDVTPIPAITVSHITHLDKDGVDACLKQCHKITRETETDERLDSAIAGRFAWHAWYSGGGA